MCPFELTIMAEVKMGEGSPKGGKGAPTEESGSGEVRHSGDGDTWRGGDTAMKKDQGRQCHNLWST